MARHSTGDASRLNRPPNRENWRSALRVGRNTPTGIPPSSRLVSRAPRRSRCSHRYRDRLPEVLVAAEAIFVEASDSRAPRPVSGPGRPLVSDRLVHEADHRDNDAAASPRPGFVDALLAFRRDYRDEALIGPLLHDGRAIRWIADGVLATPLRRVI